MPDAQQSDNRPLKRGRLLVQSTIVDVDASVPSSACYSLLKKTRGKRAALNNFIEMPFDIMFETLGHLHPFDLLRLARTTKELRHTLMSRTSRMIWKNARSNVEGLPDCPGDLSEPQYASLLFEHICQNCGASNSQQVIWTARAKFCKKCASVKFDHWALNGLSFLRQLVPSTLDIGGIARRRSSPMYYTEMALALKFEYEAIETPELQERWLSDKITAFRAIKDHGDKCMEFMADLNVKRLGDLSLIRQARRDAIIEKLKALGWGDDLAKMNLYRFSKLRDVNQPKVLTERAWQKMESNLTTFMAKERALRWQTPIRLRCANLMKIYDSLRAYLPFNMAIPNVADLALLHSARSLILDTPIDTTVTLADFNVGEFLEFFSSWLFVADEAILDIVRNSSIGPNATHSTLPLATTLFHCSTCSGTLHYPRVLVHSCLQTAAPGDGDEPENLAYMFSCLKCRPWDWTTNQKQITFDESAHRHMKALLALYHFQPVTSYDDLLNVDPFVECLTTVSSATLNYEREVMRITVAIDFCRMFKFGASDSFCRALGEEDQARAASAEQSLDASDYSSLVPGVVLHELTEICCLHCDERFFGPYAITLHFQLIHHIYKPTRFRDFMLHMDAIRSFDRSHVIRISEA